MPSPSPTPEPAAADRSAIRAVIAAIEPFDEVEATHRIEALAWVDGGAPLHRLAKPATPPEHLVSYSLLLDVERQMALLVDHRLAGLWLPTGGHVEPGEEPVDTARRELEEELGVRPPFHPVSGSRPFFITRTRTRGQGEHTDVSLWYLFAGSSDEAITADPDEFIDAAWWPLANVVHGPSTRFDPHLPRLVSKLGLRS